METKESSNFIKNNLKSNLLDWTTDDVLIWLNNEVGLDYNEYNDYFIGHEVTGRDLLDLTEDNLKNDLKVLKLHDRKLILRKICELMRLIVDNSVMMTNPTNFNNSTCQGLNTITNSNDNPKKIVNIIFKGEVVKFKCTKSNRVYNIIQDCIDIFGLPKDKYISLTDKKGLVLPRDSYLIDCIPEDEGEASFYIIINNIKKEHNMSNENIQSINNTLSEKNSSYQHHKGSILQETAIKNKFLSFEALDNFEKNGYSFSIKKNLNKNFEDKVTINSFYNISNLNNFEKSLFNSTSENKNSNYINSGVENSESEVNIKGKKKNNKFTCIRSKKKIDIEDLSEELDTGNKINKNNNNDHIKITDYKNYENNPSKIQNKNLKSKNSSHRQNISQDSNNVNYKNNYFDRLYNYYNDANKIKGTKQINETETENEIHNFLRSLKSI
jgi:hypothetical protein